MITSQTRNHQATEPTIKSSRSNSLLLTLKCELLFQMTEQLYPSLFTLTIGFLVCNFDCKLMSLVRNWHRQLVLPRDHFSNYLKQHDEKTLSVNCFIEVHIVNMIKESKFDWCPGDTNLLNAKHYGRPQTGTDFLPPINQQLK